MNEEHLRATNEALLMATEAVVRHVMWAPDLQVFTAEELTLSATVAGLILEMAEACETPSPQFAIVAGRLRRHIESARVAIGEAESAR